jgi:hypothetical protein
MRRIAPLHIVFLAVLILTVDLSSAFAQGGSLTNGLNHTDPVQTRLNLGVRSLETGASFLITARDKNGAVRTTVNKTYVANLFEQVAANTYVGVILTGSDTITISMNSGKAILYGAQTDNKTQDPSVQYFKKTF